MITEKMQKSIEAILSLEENFDEEGGLPPTKDTIEKAVRYIPKIKQAIFQKTKVEIGEPDITPCPNRSVDLYWETDEYKLLVNVGESEKKSTYYGEFGDAKNHPSQTSGMNEKHYLKIKGEL